MTMHTITDQQVAGLPIHGGRAELLEEIMSTPVDQVDRAEHRLDDLAPRRGRRALATVAAVAAVAATVGGLAAWRIPHQGATPDGTSFGHGTTPGAHHAKHGDKAGADHPATQVAPAVRSVPGGRYFALDEGGWTVTNVDESPSGMSVTYARDGQEVELELYPADAYAAYLNDRNTDYGHGTDVTVLGQGATRWAAATDGYDLIRTSEGDRFLEVSGSGMNEGAFSDLVDQIVQTDVRGFDDAMPDGVVTPFNRDEAIRNLLHGVETPPGFTAADVTLTGFNDAYHSAAGVAGAVGCAWVDVWASGSEADRQAVIDAFEGSRSWPLLQRIADQGGYSSVFWQVAHRMSVGHTDKGQPLTAAYLKSGICS
jgi:hypothetical protein